LHVPKDILKCADEASAVRKVNEFVAMREPVHFREAGFRTGKLPAKAVDLVKKCEGIVGSGLPPIVVPGCHKSV
jgi:hypothetical protein